MALGFSSADNVMQFHIFHFWWMCSLILIPSDCDLPFDLPSTMSSAAASASPVDAAATKQAAADENLKKFWTSDAFMAMSEDGMDAMAKHGIKYPATLGDFYDDELDDVFTKIARPVKRDEGVDISATSEKRIRVAALAVRYYSDTGHLPIKLGMLTWTVLANFDVQWRALKELKKRDEPDVPKLTKGLTIIKYIESLRVHCMEVVGVRNCPLVAYLLRDDKVPPVTPSPLAQDQPHSEKFGSVEHEMIARLTHTHPLFRNDNQNLFNRLDIGLRNTSYASVLVSHRRTGDGVGAFADLVSQYAGKHVWEARIREAEGYMKTATWTGTTSVRLDQHLNKHRMMNVQLSEASEHVAFQMPNERTRVTYVLDSIKSKDPEVLSGVAAVRRDDPGMRDSFEPMAAFLGPTCPVTRASASSKRANANVSGLDTGSLPQKGSPGVELRWYPNNEFKALTDEQRAAELKEWSATKKAEKGGGGRGNGRGRGGGNKGGGAGRGSGSSRNDRRRVKRQIASLVKKELEKKSKPSEKDELASSLDAMVASLVAKAMPPASAADGAKNGAVGAVETADNSQQLPAGPSEAAKAAAGTLLQRMASKKKKAKQG